MQELGGRAGAQPALPGHCPAPAQLGAPSWLTPFTGFSWVLCLPSSSNLCSAFSCHIALAEDLCSIHELPWHLLSLGSGAFQTLLELPPCSLVHTFSKAAFSAQKPKNFGTFALLRAAAFAEAESWLQQCPGKGPLSFCSMSCLASPFFRSFLTVFAGTQVTVEVHPKDSPPQLFKKLSFGKGTVWALNPGRVGQGATSFPLQKEGGREVAQGRG